MALARRQTKPEPSPEVETPASAPVLSTTVLFGPQPGPQMAFLSSPARIVIYGGGAGGGKSYGLLLEAYRHHAISGYAAALFRRTSTNLTKPGALWDEANKLYGRDPMAYSRQSPSMQWRWRGRGGQIHFGHLEHDKTVNDWHGAQLAFIGFDELTEFTAHQFWYLLTRNRSTCGVKPYVRATCNPDVDSWVRLLIDWWIDPHTGYPVRDRAGVIRWFIRVNDALIWADSKAELETRYPELDQHGNVLFPPISLTFIPSKLDDNPILTKADPSYRAALLAQPTVERERLLGGNWNIRPSAGLYFQRAWCPKLAVAPDDAMFSKIVRYWDFAATEFTGTNNPDWTVGVKMGRYRGARNRYAILNVQRFRKGPSETEAMLKAIAETDGFGVHIGYQQDPGQGGKWQAQYFAGILAGYTVQFRASSTDKLTNFNPVSSQLKAQNVDLVLGSWLEDFATSLESFPSPKAHDDDADALAGAFRMLFQQGGVDTESIVIDADVLKQVNTWRMGE